MDTKMRASRFCPRMTRTDANRKNTKGRRGFFARIRVVSGLSLSKFMSIRPPRRSSRRRVLISGFLGKLRTVSFNHFGLSPEVVRGTQAMGFVEPTPIQLRAFPIVLAGKDLIGTAQTGTGKTAAFALPILTLLARHGTFRCLVLEPTRELAAQVE